MLSIDETIQLIHIGAQPGPTNPTLPAPTRVCSTALADSPWVFDTQPSSYGPGASMHDSLPAGSPQQGMLPQEYRQASKAELDLRIRAAKAELGRTPGHPRPLSINATKSFGTPTSSVTPSSSRNAARTRPEAEAIVFCGVHFMAETADMLSRPDQAVILPNLAAGCSMADMADLDSVTDCWEELEGLFGTAPDAIGPPAGHPGNLHELLGRP